MSIILVVIFLQIYEKKKNFLAVRKFFFYLIVLKGANYIPISELAAELTAAAKIYL